MLILELLDLLCSRVTLIRDTDTRSGIEANDSPVLLQFLLIEFSV